MGRPDIRILADGEELSRVSAEKFVRLANEAVEASGRFSVSLSGLLVSWEEKAKTLRAVLQGPYQPDRLPAQSVRPVNGQLLWIVDRAAAQLLRR